MGLRLDACVCACERVSAVVHLPSCSSARVNVNVCHLLDGHSNPAMEHLDKPRPCAGVQDSAIAKVSWNGLHHQNLSPTYEYKQQQKFKLFLKNMECGEVAARGL